MDGPARLVLEGSARPAGVSFHSSVERDMTSTVYHPTRPEFFGFNFSGQEDPES